MFKTRLNRDPQIPCIFKSSVRYATAFRQNNLQIRLLPNNDRRRLHRFRMLSISPRPVFGVNDVKRDCLAVVLRRTDGGLYVRKIDKSLFGRPDILDSVGPAAGWPNSTTEKTTAESSPRRTTTAHCFVVKNSFVFWVRAKRPNFSEKRLFFFFYVTPETHYFHCLASAAFIPNSRGEWNGQKKKNSVWTLKIPFGNSHRQLIRDGIHAVRAD